MEIGRLLMILGGFILLLGLLLTLFPGKLGRLPGDIHVEGEKWSFYFPVVTCILLSVLLTLLLWFLSWFRK